MNYVTFIIRNLENVPGKSGVGQGKVRGNFFSKSVGTLTRTFTPPAPIVPKLKC